MAFKILFNLSFYLTLVSFILVRARLTRSWSEVSHLWPAAPMEYFVASEQRHHFIEIKLPEQLNSGLNLRLEYFYDYNRIRPDVLVVPCGTSIDVVRDESEQPKGRWLVHKLAIEQKVCQANPVLVYNVLLHEAGDVFAWRFVEVGEEGVNATTTTTVSTVSKEPTDRLSISCRPSFCDEKLFKYPTFERLINGLPDGVKARLHRGFNVLLNLERQKTFKMIIEAGSRKQQEDIIEETKMNACFWVELYMDKGTQLEIAIASSNNSIEATGTLEVIDPNRDAGHWFFLKRCITDYMPRLPDIYSRTAMFQFNPKGSTNELYIIMALKPLWLLKHSYTWLELLPHDVDGFQNQWYFASSGGSQTVSQNMLIEYLRNETNDYKIHVSGIDSKAESLDAVSSWMKWREGDENTWFHLSVQQADWIALVEFSWQDESGQWISTKSYAPQDAQEVSVSADSGCSTSNLVIRYRLEGMVGREYRLRIKLKLNHEEEDAQDEGRRYELLINRIALTKDRF